MQLGVAKTSGLRLSEYRAVDRLVGECRDLGDDSAAWHRHLANRLVALTGPSLVLAAELGGVASRMPFLVGVEYAGWETGFSQPNLAAALTEFQSNPLYCPAVNAYLTHMIEKRSPALTRTDMLLDSDWYGSTYFRNFHSLIGADAVMFCINPLSREPDRSFGVELLRLRRDADYNPRQKAIVREVCWQIEPLLGGPLARFEEPRPGASHAAHAFRSAAYFAATASPADFTRAELPPTITRYRPGSTARFMSGPW